MLRAGLLALVALDVIRLAVHFALFRDGVALIEIGALDLACVGICALAFLLGPRTGSHLGSLALLFVGLGLPIALLGALIDALGRPHLSLLSAFTSLLAIGVGFGLAARSRPIAMSIGALGLSFGGTYGMVQAHDTIESLCIAAPLVSMALAATAIGVWTQRAPRQPAS